MNDSIKAAAIASGATLLIGSGVLGTYHVLTNSADEQKPVEVSASPSKTPSEKPSPSETATEEPCDVEISDFDGMTTTVGEWDLHVNEAYIDSDGYITDGWGYGVNAPTGQEYHIWNIQTTNNGEAPRGFSTMGTTGIDHEGRSHVNDPDAEWTVANDYFEHDTLNPGGSVETDVIFLLSEGTALTEMTVSGVGVLAPCEG